MAKTSHAAQHLSATRHRKTARVHKSPAAAATPIVSATPSHHDQTLFVLAAAALGLLSLASLTLQRLLVRLGQASLQGPSA